MSALRPGGREREMMENEKKSDFDLCFSAKPIIFDTHLEKWHKNTPTKNFDLEWVIRREMVTDTIF